MIKEYNQLIQQRNMHMEQVKITFGREKKIRG